MAESGIRRRQSRTPEIGCRLPGGGLQSAELGSRRPIKNGNPGFRRCPERNMRLCWGRLKIPKNQKNFGRQKSGLQVPKTFDFEPFFPPGPIFRKKGEKKANPRIQRNGVAASSTNTGNCAHAFRITVVEQTPSNKYHSNDEYSSIYPSIHLSIDPLSVADLSPLEKWIGSPSVYDPRFEPQLWTP